MRETLQAEVSLQFLSWTKLTMALATGGQHMNLLAAANGAPIAADGAPAGAAIAVQAGSTASFIALAATDAAKFAPGSMIAIDADYTGQTGYVGTPVAGAYVRQPLTDIDYIRRITFNVALVSQVEPDGLSHSPSPWRRALQPRVQNLQAITGFVDREGGCFFQEWSALFVLQGSQGERVFFHYPRLQSMAGAEEASLPFSAAQNAGQARIALKARFVALPVTDALDGERVLCYRSFLPAPHALI